MKKENVFKIPLTIFGAYETIVIILLSFRGLCGDVICMFFPYTSSISRYAVCDFCKSGALKYVVLCVLVPIVVGLICWWRKEIKNAIKKIAKKSNKKAKNSIAKHTDSKNDKDEKKYGWQSWE